MTPFGTEVVGAKTSPLAICQTSLVKPKEKLPHEVCWVRYQPVVERGALPAQKSLILEPGAE